MTGTDEPRWRATPALARSVLLPAVLGAVGLAFGRVELVLLGVPLILGTALAIGARTTPAGPVPRVRAFGPRVMDVGRAAAVAVQVEPSDAQLVTTVLARPEPGAKGERVTVAAPSTQPRQIVTESSAATWGTQLLARPDHLAVADDALFTAGPVAGLPYSAQVLPAVATALPTGPLPARPAGMVGAHPTLRHGEGTELHDVAPFRPGDRLRRIDWRVTARQAGPREELFTRRTQVDADADVVCCLDNRYDLPADVATWAESVEVDPDRPPPRSSIDVAVDTVASVAAAYIAHGDRVGVLDLTRPMDMARLGSGSRHLLRLRTSLARHTHRPGSADSSSLPRRLPPLPQSAIVVLTSVFMDDSVSNLAISWRRAGHPVLAVDVLPPPIVDHSDHTTAIAERIVLTERAERLRSLATHGVLVTQADPAALSLNLARLRQLAGRGRR
ncbi:uncharacterized protein (DUF58 family) [Haloactinopolyspora alba]|uniref:Uncharacterized protein (DUF58 family) n=1 Tax=Haloactinopolyspora alba TaxID=648780 RepID=A0A2P8EBP8_9ACTN|nr:DUF58 domain-containing protein [Haloactinopolyspora alba]PSL06895.1 uncharacterized protein (DUF58 family) [Haloactinopolyspora alba]